MIEYTVITPRADAPSIGGDPVIGEIERKSVTGGFLNQQVVFVGITERLV